MAPSSFTALLITASLIAPSYLSGCASARAMGLMKRRASKTSSLQMMKRPLTGGVRGGGRVLTSTFLPALRGGEDSSSGRNSGSSNPWLKQRTNFGQQPQSGTGSGGGGAFVTGGRISSGGGISSGQGTVMAKVLAKTTYDSYGNVVDTSPVGSGRAGGQLNPWTQARNYGQSNGGSSGSNSGQEVELVKTLVKTTYDKYGNVIETTIVDDQEYQLPRYCYGSHCYGGNASPGGNIWSGSSPNQHKAPTHKPTHKPTMAPVFLPAAAPSPPTTAPILIGTEPIIKFPTQAPGGSINTDRPAGTGNSQQQVGSPSLAPVDPLAKFSPPKSVITLTNAPTVSATSPPSENLIFRKTISTDDQTYETVGLVNLVTVESEFFTQIQFMFTPYISTKVGYILKEYQLILTFQETSKAVKHLQVDDANDGQLYHNVFDIRIRLDLEGTGEELETITQEGAQEMVSLFFVGDNLKELLTWLTAKGIALQMIRVYDPENPPFPEETDTKDEPTTAAEEGKDSDLMLIVSIVCGVVVLAMLIVFVIQRRRNKMFRYYREELKSPSGRVYYDDGGSVSSAIKPAALQKKKTNQKAKPNQAVKDVETANDDPFPQRTFQDIGPTSSKEQLLELVSDGEQDSDYDPLDPLETFHDEYFQTDRMDPRQTRPGELRQNTKRVDVANNNTFDSDPQEIAAATPPNLGRQGALNDHEHTYAEFEMFVNNGQPQNGDDFLQQLQDASYSVQRRRWQEEADDSGLSGLPSLGGNGSSGRGSFSGSDNSRE